MKILLFILAILAFLSGAGILASAKSAIHEIEAFILFLISAVFISGAGVVEAVEALEDRAAVGVGKSNDFRKCPSCAELSGRMPSNVEPNRPSDRMQDQARDTEADPAASKESTGRKMTRHGYLIYLVLVAAIIAILFMIDRS